jgi:hypothetical protein
MKTKLWCFLGVHEFKIISQGPYSIKKDSGSYEGTWYSLQCICCGKILYKKAY